MNVIKNKIINAKISTTFLMLFIVRIPYLLAYYPGLMIYDTGSSIAQYYGIKHML